MDRGVAEPWCVCMCMCALLPYAQELKQQVLDLRDHVLGAEQKLAAEASKSVLSTQADVNNQTGAQAPSHQAGRG